MNESIKLKDEEIEKLVSLQQKVNDIIIQFGQLQVEKVELSLAEKALNQQYENAKSEQMELSKQLTQSYGEGRIDIESGTFTPLTN